jgi:hypothetical protein
MSKCKYCGIEGEWQQTQYGNRLFVNGEMHKCPNYQKAKGGGQQQQQQFGNRENSGTYVPQGYTQQTQQPQQISIPQPAPEPAILTQIQTTLEAIQVALKDLKKGQELMSEKIDTLYHQAMSE